ncbi:MAG: transcription-repair coupling factor [Myxococcota bacterium]|nr:transcription-repair coupling factor [Myxococcota bacterium]
MRQRSGPVRLHGLRGSAQAAVLARLADAHPGVPMLVVVEGAKAVDALAEELRFALGEPPPDEGGRVRPFPAPDAALFDRFSPQPFVVAQRMDVLHRLAAGEPPVVVAPWTALALRVPGRDAVKRRAERVAVRQEIDRDALVGRLVGAGYTRQPVVEERGELAVRGGIVDLFPPHRALPVRIELFGDEVERIREFDPASQRSQRELASVTAPPPREILCDRELVVERSDALRALAVEQGAPASSADLLIDTLLRGALPPGCEALAPLLQPSLESVFDFLPEDNLAVVVEPERGHDRLDRQALESLDNHQGAREAGRLVCAVDELLLRPEETRARLEALAPVSLARLEIHDSGTALSVRSRDLEELARDLRTARVEGREDGALMPLARSVVRWKEDGLRIVLCAPALSGAERLRKLLAEYGIETSLERDLAPLAKWSRPGHVEVRVASLAAGFELPSERLVVMTEEEVFGPRERRRKRASGRDRDGALALERIAPGDLLVHAEHGIGVYRGLVMLAFGGVEDEFLRLEYEAGDKLFLPVHRLNLVQRYVGSEGATPTLDRLGGTTWQKTRAAVKKSMRNMARELLSVHAARELAPGHAFSARDRALEEFEAAFPYEETPDQHQAIEDVLADLQRNRPMDRLVCGDVGYGKTEVAARAAYKAVMDGKQVAVLVPTTVLCQQHVETFLPRFEGTGARVESLSRFRSPKESREVLEGLASGRIDIVIGTHRLLQKNVAFRDLGLLVVDEEHRFGVTHKERIKQLKQTVDVLTLTATPIPRTLQMAFSGLRDLSVIETPPPDRLAIRTQVCRFDELLIREAILREVRRGGQVFFVHNRVRTIGALAQLLERLVPEVSVIVAHGQMKERELEEKMLAFVHGQADVLLCTTIVESGIDVPRANTMLIDRADALGLAQLYQLRGRVGRSNKRAYAYLLIPGEQALTKEAARRLEALQDLSELGSGYRLANMDLEIRGAGNLLGGEQSGNMGMVGYDTYMELLEEAIEELRGGARVVEIDPEIRLPVPARLPDDFVPDVSQRLVLYKRLAGARDEEEASGVRDELLDRFGPLPPETESLMRVIRLKIAARDLGVVSVSLERGELVLAAAETSRVDPEKLVALMTGRVPGIRVTPDQRVRMDVRGVQGEALFDAAHSLLAELRGD